MAAGIVGLALSLAGLAGLFIIRPAVNTSLQQAVDTLYVSVDSSQKTLALTDEALDAAIESVDSLADMLSTSRKIVEDTQPVVAQFNEVLGENFPDTFDAAGESLQAAQGAARSLESTIKSIEAFQFVLSGVPLISSFLPQDQAPYNPDKPLADSLGDLSESIADMPSVFKDMSKDLSKADDNLDNVKVSLDDMSKNISRISNDLEQYRGMLADSRNSMDDLLVMLGDLQKNLPAIMTTVSLVLGLFFLWLLAAQVVIFSQGWELYHGTADRMEPAPVAPQPAREAPAELVMETTPVTPDKPAAAAKPRARRVKKDLE
jgi:archaellum component FlaC